MANNTPDDAQWWAKVDIKTWIALVSVFFLVSGGVESIKSAVSRIEDATKLNNKDVEELKALHKEMILEHKKISTNDMRQDYDILDLKKRVDKLEVK